MHLCRSASLLSLLTLAACASSRVPAGASIAEPLGVPRGNHVATDIVDGYRAYGETLTRWGRWSTDPIYSVHWCPSDVDARASTPYADDGHWAEAADSASARWVSDDAETWGDITMHHGWWIQVDQSLSTAWCWVPGVSETAARVEWREADGFVAWAPTPPLYEEETDDDGGVQLLEWTYALLGELFEPNDGGRAVLHGDAAGAASRATAAVRRQAGKQAAPSAAVVSSARKQLQEYVAAHPVVDTRPATSRGGRGSASASTATASTQASSHVVSHAVTVEEGPLPSSTLLYAQLSRDPLAGIPGSLLPGATSRVGSDSSGSRPSLPAGHGAPPVYETAAASPAHGAAHTGGGGHVHAGGHLKLKLK